MKAEKKEVTSVKVVLTMTETEAQQLLEVAGGTMCRPKSPIDNLYQALRTVLGLD